MSETPLISVCLPVYNGERFLRQAIESVLVQTESNFELIICDDGSQDASIEIAAEYAGNDSRVVLQTARERKGLFGNYNHAISMARGQLIKPFAQDDLLDPDCLQAMSTVLLSDPGIALVGSARQIIDEQGNCLEVRSPFPGDTRVPAREAITFNLINLNNWIGEPATVMFRSKDKGAGFDCAYYHYGDIEYWFRILAAGDYFFVHRTLCSFRRHAASQTNKNHKEMFFALDILRLSLSYRYMLADIEPPEVFRRRVCETVALQFGFIEESNQEELTAGYEEQFLNQQEEAARRAAGFRLLCSYASGRVRELISELDHEKRCRHDENVRFAAEVDKMRNSLYWKLTGPLRAVRDALRPQ